MSDAPPDTEQNDNCNRLIDVILDEDSFTYISAEVEHERKVAIFDILEGNSFEVVGHSAGPYILHFSVVENRLVLQIMKEDKTPVATHILSLGPLRRVIKDYFMICDSYFEAIKTASPSKIEAIDMGRRGLHDEGSVLLKDRLTGKIDLDHLTSRRLFTLLCALQWKRVS